MHFTRLIVGVLAACSIAGGHCSAQDLADSVLYREVIYFSVDALAKQLQAKVVLSPLARDVKFKTKDKEWEFLDGGQRLKLPSGKEHVLKRSFLVLEGKHYFPLEECAGVFGVTAAIERKDSLIRVLLIIGKEKYAYQPSVVGSPYHKHKVESLEAVHEYVVAQKPLRGIRTMHRKEDMCEIAAGTTLIVRRKVVFDGEPHVIASDCGPSLDSFLIVEKILKDNTKTGGGADTAWNRYRKWFVEEGKKESALRRGEPKRLDKTAAVTVDLCWSLRRYEDRLFQSFKEVAKNSKKKIHPALFVSGRWLEQHPLEMHDLIEMSKLPNVEVIWGHHSWEHPKAGGFMNDFAPPRLREDTLRLERLFLEWGITPTVYYRFPGLVHDRVRLAEILDLDLFPVDCDSWLALVKTKDKGPFYYGVRDGGIILVHGNGNEPAGIPLLERWLKEHPEWELGHLNKFFPSK
jgi:hypothetical protein